MAGRTGDALLSALLLLCLFALVTLQLLVELIHWLVLRWVSVKLFWCNFRS